MKNIILFALATILFACNKPEIKQTAISTKNLELIKNYTSNFPDSTELSFAFINGEKVDYYGFVKIADSLYSKNNYEKIYAIGSISKLFTTTMLSSAIQDGVFQLNESIENHLDFSLYKSGYDNAGITLKRLANHTSGFPLLPSDFIQKYEKYKSYNKEYLEEHLRNKLQLINEPGYGYSYSNLGYSVLGYIMEQKLESSYEELLQQIICNKYGLELTTTDYSKAKSKIIVGRDSAGNITPHFDLGIYNASGGIYSNVIDLSKYIQANFYPDPVLDYQKQETYRSMNFGVALGWKIWNFGGANCSWYFHDGGLDGYRTMSIMNQESKCGVVILSNLSAFHKESRKITDLAFELIKQEYLNYSTDENCSSSFIEGALKNGWGAHVRDGLLKGNESNNSIVGVWYHKKNGRIITRTFTADNKDQTDFFRDNEIDVWGYYALDGDQISFNDIGGEACTVEGKYKYEIKNDTLKFTLISDECDGRRMGLLNDWVRIRK